MGYREGERGIGSSRRMGGGGMAGVVGNAVGSGVGAVQEVLSASSAVPNKPTTSNLFSLTSDSAPTSVASSSLPVAATSTEPATLSYSSCSCFRDHEEGDYGGKQERINGFYNKSVFEPVPSKDEVQNAVSSLQKVLVPASYSEVVGDESASNSGFMDTVSHGCQRVYDSLRLLQTEPSVQRMVVSLSTDEAVWNAVLNNNAVRELRDSLCTELNSRVPWLLDKGVVTKDHDRIKSLRSVLFENHRRGSSGKSLDLATSILSWILNNTKLKIMELIEKITKLLNEAFQSAMRGKTATATADLLENALRSSVLLTVVIHLIVIVTRAFTDRL